MYLPKFTHLTHIYKYAFSNCDGLEEFYLPDTLEFIDEYSFQNTGLTEIFIPSSVTSVKKNAFINSKIKKIYLEADEIPETFEEGFDNGNESGRKIEVILGAKR